MAAPPPSYQLSAPDPSAADDTPPDLTASFANLNIGAGPRDAEPETCLAHLKLLFAFQTLKEDVGYTDGLWRLWDTRAEGNISVNEQGEIQELSSPGPKAKDPEEMQLILSKIREKRWAIFVARAVDRYEAWWKAISEGPGLTEDDMDYDESLEYVDFPSTPDYNYWEKKILLPLDVLMVHHSHILNPYNYLEDCIRAGNRRLWSSGMPWNLIDKAINTNFNYVVSDTDKARWVGLTGRSWENAEDPLTKKLNCPVCGATSDAPWTTCGLDENAKVTVYPGLIGSGYGDGEFDMTCHKCFTRINRECLSVAKFYEDTRLLLVHQRPMPGTIINPVTGRPEKFKPTTLVQPWDPITFPNRMIKLVLRIDIQNLLKNPSLDQPPTMEDVRKMVENVLSDQVALRTIYIEKTPRMIPRITRVPAAGRLSVRKMMSRYWGNFSPFALDLCGAVMRQGIFSEKMCKIDWLHSPTARETMTRLCTKYQRFLQIMAEYPTKVAVPTLDVDLAWHTHQLSPSAYYAHTNEKMKKFIRHDDKIDEDKLEDGFEWTSKTYQQKYDEVYSECTCWYCESVRTSHISSFGRVLGLSSNEKIADSFHASGAANLCPPDNSAHISSHNAVKLSPNANEAKERVRRHLMETQRQRLEENYQKACKRAEKKGRKLPPRDEYYHHWGYSYYMYGPWVYPVYFTPGMYYAGCGGSGTAGSCAAGSCGGGVASGACGSSGGCAAGGCGGGSSGGACGGGGGGGGCGGGGGGGGGGCGGGGGS